MCAGKNVNSQNAFQQVENRKKNYQQEYGQQHTDRSRQQQAGQQAAAALMLNVGPGKHSGPVQPAPGGWNHRLRTFHVPGKEACVHFRRNPVMPGTACMTEPAELHGETGSRLNERARGQFLPRWRPGRLRC